MMGERALGSISQDSAAWTAGPQREPVLGLHLLACPLAFPVSDSGARGKSGLRLGTLTSGTTWKGHQGTQ